MKYGRYKQNRDKSSYLYQADSDVDIMELLGLLAVYDVLIVISTCSLKLNK